MQASLIISVYNNIVFLKAVLDSLKVQTVKDFEIIISEDGDSQPMKTFLLDYPFEHPWLHLSQPDVGWRKNQALNKAIQASTSEYLILIDGDCVLHSRFIEMHLKYAGKNKVLAGKRIKLNDFITQELLNNTISSEQLDPYLKRNLLKLKKQGCGFVEEGLFLDPDGLWRIIPSVRKMRMLKGCNISFSKKAILEINGFDEDYLKPAIGEDIDLTWRFKMAGYAIQSLRNLAVQYHLNHKENWTDQQENIQLMESKQRQGLFYCSNGICKYQSNPYSILLYGAIDRFNYGDLLLPLVFKGILEKERPELCGHIFSYGIIRSDLSKLGALPTKSLKEMHQHLKNRSSFVVLIGGEILSANWGKIYSFLNPTFAKLYASLKFFRKTNDFIAKLLIGGKSKRPFIIEPEKYAKLKGVLYLGAGGRRKGVYPKKTIKALDKALLVSCRDKEVHKSLSRNISNVILTPDPAILVSTIYPMKSMVKTYYLETKIKEIEPYFFFQLNLSELQKMDLKLLCATLEKLHVTYDRKIVLCPIGTALGHDDHLALSIIAEKISMDWVILIEKPSIEEIVYLIANADLYIGSSLHGVITSMSYGIPYLALRNHPKIKAYLKTWGIETLTTTTSYKDIVEKVAIALQVDTEKLNKSSETQIMIARQTIMDAIRLFE